MSICEQRWGQKEPFGKGLNLLFTNHRSLTMKTNKLSLVALASLILLSACASKQVGRVSEDEVTDLSGNWNDTDSRLVAEAMIQDFLSSRSFNFYRSEVDGVPTITVGSIKNLSHEHVNTQTFINDMERELINSPGLVRFVASGDQRAALRSERADQDQFASAETRKRSGEETGADLLMEGSINSILDTDGDQQVRFFQIDLTLIEVETNEKKWIGTKKIKKIIDKGGMFRF